MSQNDLAFDERLALSLEMECATYIVVIAGFVDLAEYQVVRPGDLMKLALSMAAE